MLYRFLALVAALAAMVPTHAASAQSGSKKENAHHIMLIVEKDNGRTIDIPAGASFRIRLPENATTGYRWTTDKYDKDCLEVTLLEPQYHAEAVGSGGAAEFMVTGRKAGSGAIELKQWRHWEGDSSVIARFRLRVNVLP